DLFHGLGGFDASRFPGAEDIDLCWRARLAGARVLVASEARVQQPEAARNRGDGAAADPVASARNRIRTLLTLSSARTLLWVVPAGVAASFVEAFLLTITLRRGRVRSTLGAWWWNLRHFREIGRGRRRARQGRRIDDRDLRRLRARGTRMRGFVAEHVASDDPMRSIAAAGLAHTLVVVLAFPVGAYGAYRFTRGITQEFAPSAVAGFAYALNPVPRNAIAAGRLGPLALFTLGPFLISIALRRADPVRGVQQRRRTLTGLLGLGALLAFTTAWYQLAPLLLLAAAAAIMVAAPLVGGFRIGVRTLVASAIAVVIAAVLLVPWSLALPGAGDDPASLGFSFRPHLDLVDVLRFHSGPAGGGWAAWGFLAAGGLALIVGRGPRFTWATRAWIMTRIGWALV